MKTTIRLVAMAAVILSAGAVPAAATPGQKCEARKNHTAGRYAACLHAAQRRFVSGGEVNTAGLDAAVLGCGTKYSDNWQRLETKAGTGVCPSEGDALSIQGFIDACIISVEAALGGGMLPSDVATCNTDLGTCTGDLGTCTGDLGTCNTDLSTTNADLGVCKSRLGTCDASTAELGDVRSGKTFSSSAGICVTGAMADNGGVILTPTTSDRAIVVGYHDGSGKCAGDVDLVATKVRNGVTLFGVVGTWGGLPKTGQTTCYGYPSTVIECAGTGQDAELQKGVANSFTDNGDGTVTDNVTGLMWEKHSDDGTIHDKDNSYTWEAAINTKIATLNSESFAGYNDWRLPNRSELLTLANIGTVVGPATFGAFNTNCAASCTVLTCSCTLSAYYWSSSTYQAYPWNAWFVRFDVGGTSINGKASSVAVRAVRAGS